MAEYTYKDVIIDPNDPRVEIGKELSFLKNGLEVWLEKKKEAKHEDAEER